MIDMIENHNLYALHSVGSVIDLEEGIVYPQLENGDADFDCGVDVYELDQEWINALSWEDLGVLNNSGIYFE